MSYKPRVPQNVAWTSDLRGTLTVWHIQSWWLGWKVPPRVTQPHNHYPAVYSWARACPQNWWFCHHLPLMTPASLLLRQPAVMGNERQWPYWDTVEPLHCHQGAWEKRSSGRTVQLLFVLPFSCGMNHLGSGTGLLISTFSGAHSCDLQEGWLASWMLDFSLPWLFFLIKLFILT